jgi:hypothetical protein
MPAFLGTTYRFYLQRLRWDWRMVPKRRYPTILRCVRTQKIEGFLRFTSITFELCKNGAKRGNVFKNQDKKLGWPKICLPGAEENVKLMQRQNTYTYAKTVVQTFVYLSMTISHYAFFLHFVRHNANKPYAWKIAFKLTAIEFDLNWRHRLA